MGTGEAYDSESFPLQIREDHRSESMAQGRRKRGTIFMMISKSESAEFNKLIRHKKTRVEMACSFLNNIWRKLKGTNILVSDQGIKVRLIYL